MARRLQRTGDRRRVGRRRLPVGFAAVIPAAGWIGDRFGTKRVFVDLAGVLRRDVAAVRRLAIARAARSSSASCRASAAACSPRSAARCSTGPSRSRSGPRRRSACSACRCSRRRSARCSAGCSSTRRRGAGSSSSTGRSASSRRVSWRWLARRPGRTRAGFDLAGLVLCRRPGVSILLYTLTIGPHGGLAVDRRP